MENKILMTRPAFVPINKQARYRYVPIMRSYVVYSIKKNWKLKQEILYFFLDLTTSDSKSKVESKNREQKKEEKYSQTRL